MEGNGQAVRARISRQDLGHVLISLKPVYADCIIKGDKCVEVRRRRVLIKPGTIVWLYATRPIASIVGFATVRRVDTDTAAEIWKRNGSKTGITKQVYFDYVDGATVVSAIHLAKINELSDALTLEEIRSIAHDFHPPQFYNHLSSKNLLRQQLEHCVRA